MRFQELSDLTNVPLCFLANATDQSPQPSFIGLKLKRKEAPPGTRQHMSSDPPAEASK
ncbi:hypothetical protein PCANC_07302 [Puccinia coronata f. sp. avenae]|uniref:Uncharacterized protein n=1 Tax=Puccinia coronata f. sp. avenae TaxID=200324 RepID=A0A2N5T6F3_9BASI|nr:hypothetical protein PCANC_07302 [Puccinia coronata f. sp. avenae]